MHGLISRSSIRHRQDQTEHYHPVAARRPLQARVRFIFPCGIAFVAPQNASGTWQYHLQPTNEPYRTRSRTCCPMARYFVGPRYPAVTTGVLRCPRFSYLWQYLSDIDTTTHSNRMKAFNLQARNLKAYGSNTGCSIVSSPGAKAPYMSY